MTRVRNTLQDLIKVLFVFTLCTCLFYFALRMVHEEYERQHRYDPPSGTAVKVYQPVERPWTDRLSIFFRLGE
ncbi:YqzK family protein [Halobacillus yeomjeoni]|uniref:YqzK family protein n=1 Tax=Halobacillus yeomjeoni TaxID=311194 RepID=A0A931MU84_9BACI|nr:YqzK family protein [Halobacillus yeomjeoni]MBH0229663.1 YqzK family protein [Halobacillus yeomjeoni]MCA0982945.1 YqzK family protein [Halobacillus yeomjeoni]